LKAKQTVKIVDAGAPHFGELGEVVCTATTTEFNAVSVRIKDVPSAVWYYKDQLKLYEKEK